MVVVHRAFGFRFVLYSNDHSPPHVHLKGQGGEAKVIILESGEVELDWSVGIARNDLKRLLRETAAKHDIFFTIWEQLHDR